MKRSFACNRRNFERTPRQVNEDLKQTDFRLRPIVANRPENSTSRKLFVTALEWMKKKICKLVRAVQKVFKPRQSRVKIYRSPSKRSKTSENGTRAKLTACESSKEVSDNESWTAVAISISDWSSIERFNTRNARSSNDTQIRLYQVSIFRAHQKII